MAKVSALKMQSHFYAKETNQFEDVDKSGIYYSFCYFTIRI